LIKKHQAQKKNRNPLYDFFALDAATCLYFVFGYIHFKFFVDRQDKSDFNSSFILIMFIF